MGKNATYVNRLCILSLMLCVLAVVLSAGCGRSYQKGTEHTLMFSAKCSNWGEVSFEEDFWADTQWMVYYDGTVECFDEYNLSGATEPVTWELSDADFETLYRLLDKKFLRYKKGTDACDGAAWSMQYYDADGTEKHSFHGYIYGISALEEIEELLAKPKAVIDEAIERKNVILGDGYDLTLYADGTVWISKANADEEAGTDKEGDSTPQRVTGLDCITEIADGGDSIYALTDDGNVYRLEKDADIFFRESGVDGTVPCEAVKIEELEHIVDIDARNNRMFALDGDGNLYSSGLYFGKCNEEVSPLFSRQQGIRTEHIKNIVAGAGNYHYFLREDGTVFSVMEFDYEGDGAPYAFIFPRIDRQGTSVQSGESYFFPEELDDIEILCESTKMGYTVYYNLEGVDEIQKVSADAYTVFLVRTDGTLWYWDSDRIKYHDNERALIAPENGEESRDGKFVEVKLLDIFGTDESNKEQPKVCDMKSGKENTLFLMSDGSLFMSQYETYQVQDVDYFRRSNPDPTRLESVLTIEDMELKKLAFEKLDMEHISDIYTDGENGFLAVDSEGNYHHINSDEGELTEEDAARTVFSYMYSDCDYDYDSMVTRTVQEEQPVYTYQTPDETNDSRKEQFWYEGLSDGGEYYIFTYYTQYEYGRSEKLYDYEYHTDYAVDKESGEVLQEREWVVTDEGSELVYSEAYQKAVNESYFRDTVQDGKMTEEDAARTLFFYMYSDCDYDYDSMVTRATEQGQPIYVYQTPLQKEYCSVSQLCCKGLTEDEKYYIFADYTDYYSVGEKSINFLHYQYFTDYAVDRETGEVLREREWIETDTELGWVYSEEYKEAVNP